MPREINYYTETELAELKAIKEMPKKERSSKIKEFCKRQKRTLYGVKAKMQHLFAENKRGTKSKTAIVSANEFIIPVKKYELRHINGELNIFIKF